MALTENPVLKNTMAPSALEGNPTGHSSCPNCPSHISNTVPPTVHSGPPSWIRTASKREPCHTRYSLSRSLPKVEALRSKLSVIPLSLSRKWHLDLGVQAYAVQEHVLGRGPHLLNTSRVGFRN